MDTAKWKYTGSPQLINNYMLTFNSDDKNEIDNKKNIIDVSAFVVK